MIADCDYTIVLENTGTNSFSNCILLPIALFTVPLSLHLPSL